MAHGLRRLSLHSRVFSIFTWGPIGPDPQNAVVSRMKSLQICELITK